MPIKRILIFALLGLITGFFSMYGYLASYTYLGKIFGDGTPYFLALVGLVVGTILAFARNKKAVLYFVFPLWSSIVLGIIALFVVSTYTLNINLDIISPIVTLGGIMLGVFIVKKLDQV
jgi:uncharacterized membrane protein YjjP (DUF1212 family)